MSTHSIRGAPLRGYRRRKSTLNLDLNTAPPGDNRDQEGTSIQMGTTRDPPPRHQGNTATLTTAIDVEAIDDDVVECSQTAFAAAKNNRRSRGRIVVDVDSEGHNVGACSHPKRRRTAQNQNIVNCDFYINLESSGNSKKDHVVQPPPPPPPPPPKELTFTCPICMGPMVDEMSTKCGHIFCKGCIKAAIAAQAKCPTCRKRVTAKELFRVFLPATNS